ncbi:hypothetical protein [Silvimonas amylolytica]|uniref:Transcriptional regulator n=1 Tax=Silvimonas amylolytica TaxID=449663 RepID=A0ABQ2PS88_9NEIS|nr:hypothetical protein [Silvimonas amylolytica]GGP28345.1 hypothetical protein GCM10010971_41640 [Silvimonas amylolytica]
MAQFTPSSGNVYADLGHTNPEGMQAVSSLVMALRQQIGARPLADVAPQLGLHADDLAEILGGHFRPEDQARLAGYVAALEATT